MCMHHLLCGAYRIYYMYTGKLYGVALIKAGFMKPCGAVIIESSWTFCVYTGSLGVVVLIKVSFMCVYRETLWMSLK